MLLSSLLFRTREYPPQWRPGSLQEARGRDSCEIIMCMQWQTPIFFMNHCLVNGIVQWLSHPLISALVTGSSWAELNSAVFIPITVGHPPSDSTQHRHWLENIAQRHLLGESQRPSGQWAHSWLQESLMALFWSKKLRSQLVASGLDQAAGEIGIKALAGTVWP